MLKRRLTVMLILTVAAATAAVAYWQRDAIVRLAGDDGAARRHKASAVSTYTVIRQPLEVTVSEVGSLRAVKNHRIHAPAILQRVTISWVIEENQVVEAGDKVIEFDDQRYQDQIDKLEQQITDQRENIQSAEDDLAYFRKLNERDIRKANDAVEKAEQALRDYRNNEALTLRRNLQQKIMEAQKQSKVAKKEYESQQVQTAEASFANGKLARSMQQQLDKASDALTKAREEVQNAYAAYKEFKNKTYLEKVTQLEEALDKSRTSRDESIKIAEADEGKYKSKIRNAEEAIERHQEEIARNREKIEQCILTAPVKGVVLYGDPEVRQYRQYIRSRLKPGGELHARQDFTLLTIPDFSDFVVDIPIGEQFRGRVSTGGEGEITVDAVAGESFPGKIKSISPVSRPRTPGVPSSPKVYNAVVTLDARDERFVSGMTARVTLTTDRLEDVLTVPIEAVFNEDGETVCYVQTADGPVTRQVVTGKLNDDFVHITDGLELNRRVWLHPPGAGKADK